MAITVARVAVLGALLWGFHNAATGRCSSGRPCPVGSGAISFPSYERIAEKADVARSTVYEAIHALEAAGILTWVNRIARIREWGPDLFGRAQNRWRVIRTSNAYTFVDPKASCHTTVSSKSDLPTRTEGQESFSLAPRTLDTANPLHQALLRWERTLEGAAPTAAKSLAN
jgi:Helix-turn-helix domain